VTAPSFPACHGRVRGSAGRRTRSVEGLACPRCGEHKRPRACISGSFPSSESSHQSSPSAHLNNADNHLSLSVHRLRPIVIDRGRIAECLVEEIVKNKRREENARRATASVIESQNLRARVQVAPSRHDRCSPEPDDSILDLLGIESVDNP
jgi:hypothetical protein